MSLFQDDEANRSRPLSVLALQCEPMAPEDPVFEETIRAQLWMSPHTRLVVLPELVVHPDMKRVPLEELAVPLEGEMVRRLSEIARRLGVFLVPGSFYEKCEDGRIANTAVVLSPDGEIVARYEKCFPWRPYERSAPGTRFVVFDIPAVGRVGISICYDSWFPEVARHLAWMGAEVIVQPTATYTSDREQELVLARATAIVNQVFVVNVNVAAPSATGRSLIVDPEGTVRTQAGELPLALSDTLDLSEVWRVRRNGTAGVTRVWEQFQPGDPDLELPLYGGRIRPETWAPFRAGVAESEGSPTPAFVSSERPGR